MKASALEKTISNLLHLRELINKLGYREELSNDESVLMTELLYDFESSSFQIIAEIRINRLVEGKELTGYFQEVRNLIQDQARHSRVLLAREILEFKNDPKYKIFDRYIKLSSYFSSSILREIDEEIENVEKSEAPNNSGQAVAKEDKENLSLIDTPDNLFSLSEGYDKLLYLKYVGVVDGLRDIHKNKEGNVTKATLSRILSHIIDKKPKYIETLLGKLDDFVANDTKNNPYTLPAVKRAIDCLNEAGVDSTKLYKVYLKLLEK